MTAADELRALLRVKFPPDQFALLYEVRDAAGFGASRSADAIIVGLWPSRGCLVEGFEVKVSRSDWLRELKKPEKAEAFVKFCDRWWVVASSDDVARLDELPATWGLMVKSGRGLGVRKEAPKLAAQPIDRGFLAAMLKRACSVGLDAPEVVAVVEARVKEAAARLERDAGFDYKRTTETLTSLQLAVEQFERASGVKITAYGGDRIGEAVRMVLNREHDRRFAEARGLRAYVRTVADYLDREFPDVPAPPAGGS